MGQELKLVEFQALYKAWKTGVPPLDHLLLGLLVWLEQKLIDNRVNVEIDEAIEEWKTLHNEAVLDLMSPIITEKPSETSTRLPELRITAPWYTDTYDEK